MHKSDPIFNRIALIPLVEKKTCEFIILNKVILKYYLLLCFIGEIS